jgi:hypothetical protein
MFFSSRALDSTYHQIEQLLKGMNTLLFTNPQVEQEVAHRLVSEIKRRGDLSLLDPNSKTPLDGY